MNNHDNDNYWLPRPLAISVSSVYSRSYPHHSPALSFARSLLSHCRFEGAYEQFACLMLVQFAHRCVSDVLDTT